MKKVLIIDDDRFLLQLLADRLGLLPLLQTETATTIAEAKSLFQQTTPDLMAIDL